jgi:hypothetical protein
MHPQAANAIKAAKHRHVWGEYATTKFLEKRKVPGRLYILALYLQYQKELGK